MTGYGIRYEYGMFHQRIEQGVQVEYPDHWLRDGNPWEVERPDLTRRVKFYGYTDFTTTPRVKMRPLERQPGCIGGALRHAHPRLPKRHGKHPAPVEGGRYR